MTARGTFEPKAALKNASSKEALKLLLRTIHTSPTALCQCLRSRDEVFEAMQITWAAPPIFCMRFAHALSELLAVHPNPSGFLNEVRAHLIERLELNAQLIEEFQPFISNADSHDVAIIMARLSADMVRVLTPPGKDTDEKTRDDHALNSSEANSVVSTTEKKADERFSDVVRWLRTQQLFARGT